MKTVILSVLVIWAVAAEAQYWPPFEYNGPWITVRDIPQTVYRHYTWHVIGAVPDSELRRVGFDGFNDSRYDYGYFIFWGTRKSDSSGSKQEIVDWPPILLDSLGPADIRLGNEFWLPRMSGIISAPLDRRSVPDTSYPIDGFGFFVREPQGPGNSKWATRGYILTVCHSPSWMRQPQINSPDCRGIPPAAYLDKFRRTILPETPLSGKSVVSVGGRSFSNGFDYSVAGDSGPGFLPTPFLGAGEPERLTTDYIHRAYGPGVTALTEPTGGALLRLFGNGGDTLVYIFCDAPTNRLVAFSLVETSSGRTPRSVKCYGLRQELRTVTIEDSCLPRIELPPPDPGYIEHFERPVDVAVSSCGRYFDPAGDFIYVADQGNRRIVKLQYDPGLDSLIWYDSFGSDYLRLPTSLDYADYGDSNIANHDIFVTDADISRLLRFSAGGVYEAGHGCWGSGLPELGYPTGVAVSTGKERQGLIYVVDSYNRRINRYTSSSSGDIVLDGWFYFPQCPWPFISAVDTDSAGNIYAVDKYQDRIFVLPPTMDKISGVLGGTGFSPGRLYYPTDIYIDNCEMHVCELFDDSSGIASFVIMPSPSR